METRFRSAVHRERIAAILGIGLGVSFTTCFLTGLLSHLIQHPPAWFQWPSRPAGLYRVTQSLHVAMGIASIPLLLAKLWTVYPKLFAWPPFTGVAHFVERVALIPLIGGGLFQLFTGVANINKWYPWPFNFLVAHYWMAWITIGALLVHLGAKLTTTRSALARQTAEIGPRSDTLERRGFLTATFGTAALLTVFSVGQTVRPLQRLALLAPRRPDIGPQGFPVNKTAAAAGVTDAARRADYRLLVEGKVQRTLRFTRDDLAALPQRETKLPIMCVEGWSTSERWRGVPVRDLLTMAGADPHAEVTVESLQQGGAYRSSELNRWHAHDPDTLLALDVNGEPLDVDHGYPLRLIGPNRPGVMQTKWVHRLVVR